MNRSTLRTALAALGFLGAAGIPGAPADPSPCDVPREPNLDSPQSLTAKSQAQAKRDRKNAARLELVRRGHLISVTEERERFG